MITTREAATRLGVSLRRVQALVATGQLPATKMGRDWLIEEADLERVGERPAGYPKGKPRKPPVEA